MYKGSTQEPANELSGCELSGWCDMVRETGALVVCRLDPVRVNLVELFQRGVVCLVGGTEHESKGLAREKER